MGQLGAIGLKAVLQLAALHVGEGLCAEAVQRVSVQRVETDEHHQRIAGILHGGGLAGLEGADDVGGAFLGEGGIDVVRTQQGSGEGRRVGRGLAIQHRVDVGQGGGDGGAESGGLGAGPIGDGSVAALGGGLSQLEHLGALGVISKSEGAGVVERHDHIADVDHLVLEVAGQLCVGDGGLAVDAVAHLEQVVALDEDALKPLEGVEADAVGLVEVAVLLHQLGGVAVGLGLLVEGQNAAQLIETGLDGGVGLEVLEGLLGHIVADHGGLAGGVIDGDGGLEEAGHLGGVLVVGSEVGGGLVGIELGQQIEAGRDVHVTDGAYGIRGGETAAHEADGQSEGADERDEFLLHKCTPSEIYFLPVFSSGGAARMSAIALRMLCSSSSGFSSGWRATER